MISLSAASELYADFLQNCHWDDVWIKHVVEDAEAQLTCQHPRFSASSGMNVAMKLSVCCID